MAAILNPELAPTLSDARLQLHHAAQLATAVGISYLPKQADDSHTNLEWFHDGGLLASNVVPVHTPFRIGVRFADLTLVITDAGGAVVAQFPLDGQTIERAAAWVKETIAPFGADAARYTRKRHYEIPHHAVVDGAPFDASNSEAFAQHAAWFDFSAGVFEPIRRSTTASDVRCWPHHFDIATLITVSPGKTVGVGLSPGDGSYDEPYFYVNLWPYPPSPPTTPLAGLGTWHTEGWLGAVLPVSRLDAETARANVGAFLPSAITACRAALG